MAGTNKVAVDVLLPGHCSDGIKGKKEREGRRLTCDANGATPTFEYRGSAGEFCGGRAGTRKALHEVPRRPRAKLQSTITRAHTPTGIHEECIAYGANW